MNIATVAPRESGGNRLTCSHGVTSHSADVGSKSRDPAVMLRYHHQRLPRCTCRLAGAPAPTARPAATERKAARPAAPTPRRTPAPERKAPLKPTEAEILGAVGAVQAEHGQIPRESWAAVEPAVRLAKQELGLGQLDVRFFLAGGDDDPPRGLTHKDYPRLLCVRLDQAIPDLLESAFHEVCHLKQARDRAPGSKEAHEHEAQMFGSHWAGICATEAYAW
jgi:hypothetical protein